MRIIFMLGLALWSSLAFCLPSSSAQLLKDSEQMLVVLTPGWESMKGKMQFFQRPGPGAQWEKVGNPVPVVVGRSGLGWGAELAKNNWPGPVKKEGDGRSPVGVFKLGPAFGFEPAVGDQIKLDYFPLTDTSVCVDDGNSQYYNQLVDSSKIAKPDWTSGEQMRQIPLYKWGSVIQYNMDHPVAGSGSCIFLHIWRGEDKGTAGCVALDENQLTAFLSQLKPAQKPVMAILSEPALLIVKKEWDLPEF